MTEVAIQRIVVLPPWRSSLGMSSLVPRRRDTDGNYVSYYIRCFAPGGGL
jgi:hypothetical protein